MIDVSIPPSCPPGAAGGTMFIEEHTMLKFGIVRQINNIQFRYSGIIDVFDDYAINHLVIDAEQIVLDSVVWSRGARLKLLNFLLSALEPEDLASLSPGLTEVVLAAGEVIFEPGAQPDAVYFPGGACISIVTIMSDGRAVENTTVGRESAAGLMEAITNRPATARAFAQIGGGAMRLSAAFFRTRMLQSPTLAQLTLLHVRANSVQAEQGVACNAAHDVSARLSRWLLMTQDRVGAKTFPLTQDYMAVMTGVQRSTVSLAASGLKKLGVIDYSRGQVTILDRASLLRHACECYGIIGSQFEDLRASVGD